MSAGAQAVFFFIAFAAFVVAAVMSAMSKVWWQLLVAAGLASWVFVPFWIAVKA